MTEKKNLGAAPKPKKNTGTLVPSPHQHSLQTHKFDFWILEHKIFTYILLDYLQPHSQSKCKYKLYIPESKNQIFGFAWNANADSELTWYSYLVRYHRPRADLNAIF